VNTETTGLPVYARGEPCEGQALAYKIDEAYLSS